MSLRPWLVLGSAVILVGANGYLLFEESREKENGYTGIAPGNQKAKQQLNNADPLRDLLYNAANRAENLKKFGMDDEMVAATIRKIEESYAPLAQDKLAPLMRQVKDAASLADAFCGYTAQIRPHYGALRFLVEEKRGQRVPIDLRNTYALEEKPWAQGAYLGDVYSKLALSDTPPPDATVMAIAAILTKNELKLLERRRPWGEGRNWSWEQVKEDNPGVQGAVVEYFALMHVAVETATSDGGVCDQRGSEAEEGGDAEDPGAEP